jgi:hypothetical protein
VKRRSVAEGGDGEPPASVASSPRSAQSQDHRRVHDAVAAAPALSEVSGMPRRCEVLNPPAQADPAGAEGAQVTAQGYEAASPDAEGPGAVARR